MTGRMRKFGAGMPDGSGYAAGVRLGNAKTAKWLHRKSGGRCMTADADDLGEAEGGKARQHLGRPGRKAFKAGGMAKLPPVSDADEDGQPEKTGWVDKGVSAARRWMNAPTKGELKRAYDTLDKYKPAPPREVPKMSTEDAAKYFEKDGSPGVADYIRKGVPDGKKSGGSVKRYAKGGFLNGIKRGALRAEMGVKSGDKIPVKKLDKATHSSDPLLKKRAVLAKNMKSWNKG